MSRRAARSSVTPQHAMLFEWLAEAAVEKNCWGATVSPLPYCHPGRSAPLSTLRYCILSTNNACPVIARISLQGTADAPLLGTTRRLATCWTSWWWASTAYYYCLSITDTCRQTTHDESWTARTHSGPTSRKRCSTAGDRVRERIQLRYDYVI